MQEAEESGRAAKKLLKKQRKSQAVAQKETGFVCCDIPTKNLLICNAGLSNGLTEEVLLDSFLKHGPLQGIAMLPGKSCCFITYENASDAESAYNAINGKLNIAQDNKPVYLGYTEGVVRAVEIDFNEKPPGLTVIPDFITAVEEELLLALNDFQSGGSNALKHRQVLHCGYEFRYDINNVDKEKPLDASIPEACDFLWERLANHDFASETSNKIIDASNEKLTTKNSTDSCRINPDQLTVNEDESDEISLQCVTNKPNADYAPILFKPDQLTVNYYEPGHGIPPHVDTHSAFEDPILSLSLGSGVVMDFRHSDGRHHPVFLPRRSLAIISGESRFDWSHGITPRKYDTVPTQLDKTVRKRGTRTSFTFRTVRRGECNCPYTGNCDSYKRAAGELEDDVAVKLERVHVHEVYESIASHFSATRHTPWPNVLKFVQSFRAGSVLVDIGCGNGKYLGQKKDVFDVGCDTSFGLIDVCNERGFQVLNANCLQVPLRDGSADGVISIAVIHHLSTEARRKQAIREMVRILRLNGLALIYVWAKDQCRNDKSSYIKQDRKNRKQESDAVGKPAVKNVAVGEGLALPVHNNRKQFQHRDLLVPWKLKKDNKVGDEFLRYYHVFEEGELEVLCKSLEEVEVVNSYYEQGNWCVVFRKMT